MPRRTRTAFPTKAIRCRRTFSIPRPCSISFPPVNPIPQTTLNGPEFGIFNTDTSLARDNVINDAVYGALGSNTQLDFSPVINAGTSDQMISWLDTLFLHSSTPDQMKQIISTALSAYDPSDIQGQAQAAIYLYLSSSMYQVQH